MAWDLQCYLYMQCFYASFYAWSCLRVLNQHHHLFLLCPGQCLIIFHACLYIFVLFYWCKTNQKTNNKNSPGNPLQLILYIQSAVLENNPKHVFIRLGNDEFIYDFCISFPRMLALKPVVKGWTLFHFNWLNVLFYQSLLELGFQVWSLSSL